MKLTLKILDKDNNVLIEKAADNETYLVYDKPYEKGDKIVLQSDSYNSYLNIKLDDTMDEVFTYLTKEYVLPIPFDTDALSYNPKSFTGSRHYLYVKIADTSQITQYKNLALNPYDHHNNTGLYPHSYANVETRGESVFASRNAIDGLIADDMHGEWPWTSWGINQNPKAEFHLDFGRKVMIDKVTIYLRADFPHDGCWQTGDITFDDNTVLKLNFEQRGGAQHFYLQDYGFNNKTTTSLKFDNLIKYDDHSPFPALTQIQVWGTETK